MQENNKDGLPENLESLSTPAKPTKRRKTIIIAIIIAVATIGFLLILPFLLLAGGFTYLVTSYSADPSINVNNEKTHIAEYLHTKYGKKFTIGEVKTEGRKYLGDSQSISAEAYPDDDKNVKVSLNKTLGYDKEYNDNYLSHVWGTQARVLLSQKIEDLYDTPPEFKNGISPNPAFNKEYKLGRVMSLEEAIKEVPDKINYQMEIIAGANGTMEEHSSKFFSLKEYMNSMYKGTNSHIWYDFTQDSEIYRCFLPGFRLQFIESDRQVQGCWYPTGNNTKPTYTPTEPVKEVEGEALPIIIRLSGATITKLNNSNSTTPQKSYVINNGNLVANLDIYNVGFGEKINEAKKQFIVDQVSNIPVSSGMNSTVLEPDQSVDVGAIRYRRDMNQDKRIVHYVLAYKTFVVHVHAVTYDRTIGLDARDKEFWLYNFTGNLEPVDGFKET